MKSEHPMKSDSHAPRHDTHPDKPAAHPSKSASPATADTAHQSAPVSVPTEVKPLPTPESTLPNAGDGARKYRVMSDKFVYAGVQYSKGQTLMLSAKDAAQVGSSVAPV